MLHHKLEPQPSEDIYQGQTDLDQLFAEAEAKREALVKEETPQAQQLQQFLAEEMGWQIDLECKHMLLQILQTPLQAVLEIPNGHGS